MFLFSCIAFLVIYLSYHKYIVHIVFLPPLNPLFVNTQYNSFLHYFTVSYQYSIVLFLDSYSSHFFEDWYIIVLIKYVFLFVLYIFLIISDVLLSSPFFPVLTPWLLLLILFHLFHDFCLLVFQASVNQIALCYKYVLS